MANTFNQLPPCLKIKSFYFVENFLEVKLTVPPHIKAKPTDDGVPVVGSRKRKARKHSITHLQPVRDAPKTGKKITILVCQFWNISHKTYCLLICSM